MRHPRRVWKCHRITQLYLQTWIYRKWKNMRWWISKVVVESSKEWSLEKFLRNFPDYRSVVSRGGGGNTAPDARLDIHARGFWSRQGSTFFDVRVCHPNAESYKDLTPQQIYRQHENEKKSIYASRVMEVEQATFTPLVFTTTGGMAPECQVYHKRLGNSCQPRKAIEDYSTTLSWIRTRISFAILRTCILPMIKGIAVNEERKSQPKRDGLWHRKRTFRTLDFDLEKRYWILHIQLLLLLSLLVLSCWNRGRF